MSKILYFCIVRIIRNFLIQHFTFLSFNKNKIIICPNFIFLYCANHM
jgi:hypothetical protein